jgi:acetylornithine deacetylase
MVRNMNKVAQRTLEWIDDHRDEIISFLQALLRIPSVNPWFSDAPRPSRELDVQAVIRTKMESLGAAVDMWEPDTHALAKYRGRPGYYPDRDFSGRPNLAATLPGQGGGRSLLFFGHVDVVSPGAGWTVDPFAATRRGRSIFGRGAVDMKGGLAAMIMAVEAIVRSGARPRGTITIGTVVDEEAGGMGTLAFVDRGYKADACVLTEPTDLAIAPLCRGILWGKIVLHGRSGHIEMPQGDWRAGGAVDAIDKLHLFLDQIARFNADWALRKTHPLLPIPCQLRVAQIIAGEYPTTFANRAEIIFNAQYLPSEKDERGLGGHVKGEIEEFIHHVALTDPWLRDHPPEVHWLLDADCGETPSDHEFVKLCVDVTRRLGREGKLEGISSHTDMGWLVAMGIPTVNFGPGHPHLAHQSDENLDEGDLVDASRILALVALEWCTI